MARGYVYRPTYTYEGKKRQSSVWWIGYSVDGEKRRESAKTEYREEAERYLTRRLRELDVHGPRERGYGDVRFAELAKLIRDDYERNNRRSSVGNRLSHLEDFFGKNYRVARIQGPQVEAYVTDRLAGDDSPANATVNRELACLRRMLNLGEKAGLVAPGTVPAVSDYMLREDNARTGFVSPAEYQRLNKALPARLRPLVEFAYVTGWRKRELLSRDWRHVDLEHGWLRLEPGESKSGKGRQFPMIEPLPSVLEAQLERKEQVEQEYGCTVDALFFYYEPSRNGLPAGRRIKSFRRAWTTATKAAGEPDRDFHDFRRTAVRNLVRSGVTEKVAMRLTGHQTRSVFDRYDIVTETDLREQSAKLEAHLEQTRAAVRGKEQAKNRGKVSDTDTTQVQTS